MGDAGRITGGKAKRQLPTKRVSDQGDRPTGRNDIGDRAEVLDTAVKGQFVFGDPWGQPGATLVVEHHPELVREFAKVQKRTIVRTRPPVEDDDRRVSRIVELLAVEAVTGRLDDGQRRVVTHGSGDNDGCVVGAICGSSVTCAGA